MRPSLLVARIGGTEIRLHWTMLLILPYVFLVYRPTTLQDAGRGLLLMGMIFFSVLLHELGHLAVARLYKLRVSNVVLWLLGGAAVTEHEADDPGAQLLIAVAGPVVNLLVAALVMIGLVVTGLLSFSQGGSLIEMMDRAVVRGMVFVAVTNLILAFSNLLPIYPLDGGRIFRAVVHMVAGPAWSAQVTFWISAVLALVVLVWAVIDGSWLLFATALLLLFGALSLNQGLMWSIVRVFARIFKRADLYIRLADFDPAVQLLTAKINQNPHNADLYLQRAYAHYFLEDMLKARSDTERALALNPAHLPAILLQGSVTYAMGLDGEAWRMVDRAETLRPGWSVNHLNRAILLRGSGQQDEAMKEANLALEKVRGEQGGFSNPVLVHLIRSMLLWDANQFEEASGEWEAAWQVNPREAAGVSPDRARIYARNWPWAEAYFTWLEKHGADRALLAVSRGEVALRAGQFERAAGDFGDAQKAQPALRDLGYYRGQALLELGQQAEAVQEFQRAKQVTQRAHIRRLAAEKLKHLIPYLKEE